MNKLNGFYNPKTAREKSPAVSRPDLVAERNAASVYSVADPARSPVIKSTADIRALDPTDTRIKCFRPNGTCYAVVSPLRWQELRDKKRLDKFLEEERDSGIVIDTVPPLSVKDRLAYYDRGFMVQ